jgi:hypothetical protein
MKKNDKTIVEIDVSLLVILYIVFAKEILSPSTPLFGWEALTIVLITGLIVGMWITNVLRSE